MKALVLPHMRLPLRWKVLLYSSGLLLALIGAMLLYVSRQAGQFVNERLSGELVQGRQRIQAVETDRLQDLRLSARLLGSLPQLKALLETADLPTIRDFLLSYQQQNKGVDLLLVLDPSGKVLARTDSLILDPLADAEKRWVRPALAGQSAAGVLATSEGLYNVVSVPAEAGGTVFGFVMTGSSIDDDFARQLRDVSHQEVVIVGDRILGSTLADRKLPWTDREGWRRVANGESLRRIEVGGESYMALLTPLGPEGELLVVCLQSRDRALAPYRRIQYGLLTLGLFAAMAGIAGSAFLAGTITAPVRRLVGVTREVAAGNLDIRMELKRGDEIGDLAQAFNVMIQGLRERADMQKFISQSTVEMIQASSQKPTSTGERKLLTVFFSDMRGFTSYAEDHPPEEVVKMLNSCLSLQAEKVKKFHGDIDKYVGDCVVAVFSDADMVLHAIRCAVEIHKALDAYNAQRPGVEPITVGIGIVMGEVILGSIGGEDRLDYTVIGSNVNLCARLCSLAGPRETLLSESTFREVQDLIAAQRLDPINVKGLREPVPVFKMTPK